MNHFIQNKRHNFVVTTHITYIVRVLFGDLFHFQIEQYSIEFTTKLENSLLKLQTIYKFIKLIIQKLISFSFATKIIFYPIFL